jgi:Flp pilus assembly protein TadD
MAEIALSYANVGNVKEAETLIGRARALDKKDVNIAYTEVQIAALTGKSSQAVALLADALENHFSADYAANDPDLDSLHNNPDFVRLMKKYSKKP